MKVLLRSGVCLVLALLSTESFAQEGQGRAGALNLGTPSPLIASSPITPVSYNATAGSGIDLGRPIAVSGQQAAVPEINQPDFRPKGISLDRPEPLIRGQAPDLTFQTVPANPPSKTISSGTPNPLSLTAQPSRVVGMPVVNDSAGPMPRMAPAVTISGSCGCGTSVPVYSGAAAILDGGGIISPGDCGCGCFNECGCGCGDECGYRGRRFYASASYLGWAFERKNIPALVTVSPAGTPNNVNGQSVTGTLGQPMTSVLFNQDNQESPFHSGGRFNLGVWGPAGYWALEVDFMFLSQNNVNATFGSNGDPQIARPIVIMGNENHENVSYTNLGGNNPPSITGRVSVNSNSEMWGFELNARQKLFCCPIGWVDMLYGYRHWDLSEGIAIREDLNQASDNINSPPFTNIKILDSFHTRNMFNGGQIGIQGESHVLPDLFPRLFLGASLKVALGDMRQQVNIGGSQSATLLPVGPTATVNTGILASTTNSGNFSQDRFAVIPELNLKLGFEINDHWRAWVGYDFLYASSVVRPGDQIDRRISQVVVPQPGGSPIVANFPPAGYPAVLFRTTSFYAQGVSFGLQYRW